MNYYKEQISKFQNKLFGRGNKINHLIAAKQFIDTNYNNKIDLNKISRVAFLSKFHFIRSFTKIYGITPHKHLTEVRIKYAKKLLNSGMKVADVCFSIGFESISSFIILFKKETGITPGEFPLKKKQFSITK